MKCKLQVEKWKGLILEQYAEKDLKQRKEN